MSFKNWSFLSFFIVLFLLSTSIIAMVYKLPPKPTLSIDKKLDLIALDYEYGYKAANLTILKDVTAKFNTTHQLSTTLEVPSFSPIPSNTIQNFIKQHTSIDSAQEWKRIITTFFPDEETKNKTITDKQFPDGFLTECSLLEKKIKEEVAAIHITDTLGTAFNIKELDTIIHYAITHQERLMIRSSGKEDTKELANAGGNITQANVIPKTEYIIQALAEVVASYFSSKSLTQRLGAQDPSLFDLSPLTPVIIQRMIHNTQGIPTKCGVMFTEETEGGIAQYNHKNNDGLTETTGITVIQAAYGHNEGVVNSLVPVDTYYATADKKIFTVIRPKTYRMAPTEKSGELELKKNAEDIIDAPALNTETVKALKLFATELERTYGYPMDVEFVVNEDEKKIYIVQARPLVYDTNTPPASYIINPDLLDAQKFIGSAIGVAGGALRYCTSAQEIVIANTINQALLLYQKNIHGLKKESVQCILIGEMAPRTSHEATTFRSENKPVIYLKEYQAVAQLLRDNSNINIIISPQQGLVANLGDQTTSIDQLIKDHKATLGWTCYPIDRFLSLNNEFNPHLSLTDKAIQKLFAHVLNDQQLNAIKEKTSFLSLADLGHTWKKALHTIKTGSIEEASVALAVLLYEIRTIIEQSSKHMELDADLQKKTAFLQSYLLYCAQNIQTNLHITPTDFRYTQRLFAIQILESILYQQPLLNEIIDGYSVTTVVTKELLVEQKIVQQAQATNQPLDDLSIQFMKIKNFAFSPKTEEQWTNFINQLALPENTENRKTFSFLIKQLAALNILPIWLNTAFAEKAAKSTTLQLFTELLKEYITQKNFLDIITEKRDIIAALNKQAFANPKTFHTQWQTFNENVLKYFLSEEFFTAFIQANALGQLAALETMNQLIEAFDESIKAVTGSTDYSNDETKVENFYSMLMPYAELFKKWVLLVPQGIIKYRPTVSEKDYIDIITRTLIPNTLKTKNLKATPHLNLGIFTINSGFPPQEAEPQPQTYEDVFSMIHQCLLAIIGALNQSNNLINNLTLPKLLKQTDQTIKTISSGTANAFRTGINITPIAIELIYNIPLRIHSLQIKIYYKKSSELVLELIIYGENHNKRWDKIGIISKIITKEFDAPVKNVTTTKNGSFITLRINENTDLEQLKTFIETIIQYTYKRDAIKIYSGNLIQDIQNIEKNNSIKDALIFLSIFPSSGIILDNHFLDHMKLIITQGLNSLDEDIKLTTMKVLIGFMSETKIQYSIEQNQCSILSELLKANKQEIKKAAQDLIKNCKPPFAQQKIPNFFTETSSLYDKTTNTIKKSFNWLTGLFNNFFYSQSAQ